MTLRSFFISRYTFDAIAVPYCMNSTITTPFLFQKTAVISFLVNDYLKIFGLFGECVCIYCDCSLVSTYTLKPRFHHLLFVLRDWEIHHHLCGAAVNKSKPKQFSAFCARPWAFSEPILRRLARAYPNYDDLVENSTWNLWKFTRKFWNCVASSFTIIFVKTLDKIITHYRWPTTSLFIVNICSPTHLWTFCITVLQFLHSSHFGRKPQHSCF
jgi:hypothetical protein